MKEGVKKRSFYDKGINFMFFCYSMNKILREGDCNMSKIVV